MRMYQSTRNGARYKYSRVQRRGIKAAEKRIPSHYQFVKEYDPVPNAIIAFNRIKENLPKRIVPWQIYDYLM